MIGDVYSKCPFFTTLDGVELCSGSKYYYYQGKTVFEGVIGRTPWDIPNAMIWSKQHLAQNWMESVGENLKL